ncbi:ABC transporter ATP-binding protein [Abyssalbus ytuae]|uniref:ATP-binding cassette domain-containing protein n=1 Tax=Abyssalbus ytuae TaxID=2926907 RepID=A0A9E6ZTK3_9FLAO|nr:ATP-binding cassette domain-containing protein [Abyssalbus ytuae]UOB18633.1 ATP-binding cassette domain-containing protein [Abyssalbus ytuae]
MIQTENLTFQYHKKGKNFHFPDLFLRHTEHLLILGKSGIGKTTLLHLMAGLLQPGTGSVTIDGICLQSFNNKQLDRFVGQNIGLVFQKNLAVWSLNVIENIQARLFFSRKKVDNALILNLLDQLNIGDCRLKKINELSEGQLQRLGIALAVIHKPKVILADEPTSSLDDENCKIVIELLIKQAKQTNANLIVITHDHRVKSLFSNSITL